MKSIFLSVSLFISFTLFAQQKKTFIKEYSYQASEIDSKVSSRAIATNQLRSTLLNEVGVYVESEGLLKTTDLKGIFSQDFVETISTISAGTTNFVILDEQWNGKTFWMKASIIINTSQLEESLKELINDRQKVKEFEELKQRLNDATKEIEKLKTDYKQNPNASNQNQAENYNNEINGLLSGDLIFQAEEKARNKDLNGAIDEYNKAIEIDPNNSLAFYKRGATKHLLGNYQGSIADYNTAIKLNPHNSSIFSLRALSKGELNDKYGAIEDYTTAIDIDPSAIDYYNRGTVKKELEDYRGAIEDFDKAIKLNPNYDLPYMSRGYVKVKLSDYQGAISDYTQVIEINPNDYEAYNNRGNVKEEIKEYHAAIKDFNKALLIAPNSLKPYENRARVKMKLRDYLGAIVDYTKAIEFEPNNSDAYLSRGLAKLILKQVDSGCLDLSKAGELGDREAYEWIKKYCN